MPLYITLSAIAVAAAIPTLAWGLVSTRADTRLVRRNLGTSLSRPVAAVSQARRSRAARRPSASFLPKSYVADIARRLDRAGMTRTTVESYLATKTTAVVVVAVAAGFLGLILGGPLVLVLPFIAVILVWLLPDLQLSGKATEREAKIEQELPDVLDQLTISVEAGLGFDSALKRLSETSDGLVTDQLSRVLQDMRLGLSRDAALKALADRTESGDLRAFANAMAQAGKHGLAIGSVLRAQAAEAREKRKFRAEERAHKVPVKILLPLVLCVLPTLFIVLIGPAVIRYQEGF